MIDDILKTITDDDEFANIIREKYPEIAPEVLTYSLNPSCSCKKKVKSFIESNYDKISSFHATYLLSRTDTENENEIESEAEEKRNLVGEVIELGPDPSEYSQMIEYITTKSWTYNGVSMMETEKTDPDTNENKIIWLAFFY